LGVSEVTPNLTLLLAFIAVALVNEEVIDASDSRDCGRCRLLVLWTTQLPRPRFDGDFDTFEIGAKRPKFGRQSQYLFPSTDPSFFPLGSSNSTPHHSPLAKEVNPIYLNVPIFEPWLDLIMTLSPILKSTDVDAKLLFDILKPERVLCVGEMGLRLTAPLVGDGEALTLLTYDTSAAPSRG